MTLLRMQEASEYSGLHPHTLRKYIDEGVIKGRKIGTHRYVDTRELDRLMGCEEGQDSTIGEEVVIYARVSTRKQQENLERQKQRLEDYCKEHGWNIVETVHEIASLLKNWTIIA